MTRLRRTLADRKGVAAIEAALLGGLLLVPLLAGAADFGLILASWAAATRAEQAGLFYAFSSGASASGIEGAARAAYGGVAPPPTVTASSTCYCLPSTQSYARNNASPVACTVTCRSGDMMTQFVTVSVSTSVTLPVPLPGIPTSYPVATTATARLQ